MTALTERPKTEKAPVRLLSITAENVKRLHTVFIEFGPGVTVIGGKNGAGKSSTIDAISYAIGGEKLICERPIRDGELEAFVRLDMGEYIVTRTWKRDTVDGPVRTNLIVANPEGAKYQAQQTLLNSFYCSFTFDPLEFSRQDPKKQLETLKALVGLDLSELDRERAALYEERTLTGRDLTAKKGQLTSCVFHEDAPAEEVDVQALQDRLAAAYEHNGEYDRFAARIDAMRTETERRKNHVENYKAQIKETERQLQLLRDACKDATTDYENAVRQTEEAIGKQGTMERKDTSAIAAQLTAARDINARVRDNAQRTRVQSEVDKMNARYEEFTAKINGVEERKRQALAAVTFPVEGLSFDETGVLFNGIPFSQASSAESLRVSVAMGAAMSPRFRTMFVKDGSLLDTDSMRLMAELAAEHDFQILMERVGTGEEVNVVIEEGLVAA